MSKNISSGILIAISILSFSACTIKTDKADTKAAEDVIKKMEEDNKQTQEDFDNILNNPTLVAGGQPGKITVSGIIINPEGETLQLDERITVSQTPGKSSSNVVTTQVGDKAKAVLSANFEAKELEKLSKNKDFINLNCQQFDRALVEGLKESEAKPLSKGILMISANTVLACKNIPLSVLINSISADHLVLIDVDATLSDAVGGSISLATNKLTLIGKNVIVTKGVDSSGYVLSAADIELKVAKTIDGDGTLQLISTGGNNIKSEKKK